MVQGDVDHPHWVKHIVYSKLYLLLIVEFLQIGTILSKSTVENMTRDCTVMDSSL